MLKIVLVAHLRYKTQWDTSFVLELIDPAYNSLSHQKEFDAKA